MNVVKLIGLKRVTFLAILLGVAVFFAGAYFVVFNPMLNSAESDLANVNRKISSYRGKITNIKKDIEFMQDNIPRYQEVQSRGMFNKQDRFDVERLVEDMKMKAGENLQFNYNISDIKKLDSTKADDMGYQLVSRTIKLSGVQAILDMEVYKFFQTIKDIFPRYTQIKSFKLKRTSKVNYDVLIDVANRDVEHLVSGDLEFDWVTLTEKPEEDEGASRSRRGGRGRR